MLQNTDQTYGLIARIFHWLVALLIITLLIVGFYMTSLEPTEDKFKIYGMHKAFGLTVFVLILLRTLWRITNKYVQPPPDLPEVLKIAAVSGHLLLYVLMLVMPTSGMLMSLFGGHPISYFGLFTIDAFEKNAELAATFKNTHETTAWILVILISAHILAAIYHHFIRKDNVLLRMLKQT
ncbi:MAG: cytochrome b [Rickettsiales bacterium]|nr:cytochrome b [Rickettsiales bacterium]MCA0253957.1 cytochrome b [Pseudomonadota bacterium]